MNVGICCVTLLGHSWMNQFETRPVFCGRLEVWTSLCLSSDWQTSPFEVFDLDVMTRWLNGVLHAQSLVVLLVFLALHLKLL